MKVEIETIDHKDQRYDTCGDWMWDGETLKIKVSKFPRWQYEMAIAVHELVESLLCAHDGVDEKSVDDFDLSHKGGEPGDEPNAPYRDQHCLATAVERMLIAWFRLSWKEYEDAIDELQR